MIYSFPTFKFYIFGLLILILLFTAAWLPKAEIELTSISEPLLLDFEVNLNRGDRQPLLNLGIISSKIIDINSEEELNPDYIMDFRKMNFPDKVFKLVVFEPPHLRSLGKNSYFRKKFG